MTRIVSKIAKAPTDVPVGGEFDVEVMVDNKETVPPIIQGGNCQGGSGQMGEKVTVNFEVLDSNGSVVCSDTTTACPIYSSGITPARAFRTFTCKINEPGDYVINVTASTHRNLASVVNQPDSYSFSVKESNDIINYPGSGGGGGNGDGGRNPGSGGFNFGNWVITHPVESAAGALGFTIIANQALGE